MFNRSKFLAASLLVLVFLAGGVAGAFVVATWGNAFGIRRDQPRAHISYTDRLTQELKLSPAQHDSVLAIVSRRDTAMRLLWQATRPKVDTLRAQVRAEIMGVLNDQQKAAFEALIQASDRRRPDRGDHEQR